MEGSLQTHKDVRKEKKYWDEFYSSVSNVPVSPSQFCVFVAAEVDEGTPIVEFGCGNGRDSFFFSMQGFPVFASDVSKRAIGIDQGKTGNGVLFFECDCTDDAGVANLFQKARQINSTIAVYNRFFLHTIDEKQECLFLGALQNNMIIGDMLYMEFRCNLDETLPKTYGKDHYRRYVKTDNLLISLLNLGFEIKYKVTGQGMATYRDEDPFVSRIVAMKIS